MKKIVELKMTQTRNFSRMSGAEGFDAIGAENGLVGVQRAQSQLPDLVICDIMMPELDGYRVLLLRQNPVTAIIPFMFITAMTAEAERRLSMYLGSG